MSKYSNPVTIFFGIGEFKNLSKKIKGSSSKNKRILLLTGSNFLKRSGHLDRITNQLKEYDFAVYDRIPSKPDIEDIFSLNEKTNSFEYNYILAVGGGSVIDAGKALSALKKINIQKPQDVRDAIKGKSYEENTKCPIVAVPTTAGTGSEVTCWATVWDKELDAKHSIEGYDLYPEVAIIDPELTVNMPPVLTVSSALDAISHAVEAYWSKNSNEIVRMYALKAVENIAQNLNYLMENPEDINLRSKIAYGSLFAGLAFSNTKTTACHSISYPLTLMYGLNHGIAVSLTLGKMLLKNEKYLINKDALLNAFGVSNTEQVDEYIQGVFAKAGISSKLKDYGITLEDLPLIADKSFTPGRMDNNPVDIDKSFILDLLESIY